MDIRECSIPGKWILASIEKLGRLRELDSPVDDARYRCGFTNRKHGDFFVRRGAVRSGIDHPKMSKIEVTQGAVHGFGYAWCPTCAPGWSCHTGADRAGHIWASALLRWLMRKGSVREVAYRLFILEISELCSEFSYISMFEH